MSADRGRRRRAARTAVLLVLALTLCACATIPTSGPVRQGRDLAQEPELRPPRSVGRDPVPGAGPEAIVRGFLQSGADFLDDHKYAREYLAPSARARWNPGKVTTIYDRAVGFSIEVEAGQVLVTAVEVARIDQDGRYQRVGGDASVVRAFGVNRLDGEWRITDVADGLLLSTSDVESAYRHFNLYFLAPTTNTVVPDPVLLPDLPGLTSKLITRLLQGPNASLRGAVVTAFPQGTRLEVGSVPVRDGVATVRLDDAALQADADARERMSAQIVWTLRQLQDVLRIRILAAGDDLVTSGVAREQPRSAWATFDPDILGSSAALFIVQDGRVGQLVDGKFTPALGAAGLPRSDLRRPAVSLDGTRIAAITADRTGLVVGRLAAGAALTTVLSGPGLDLSPPSWDRNGDLWLADRTTNRLMLVGRDETRAVTIPFPKLSVQPLQVVRVARDGTRIALAAGTGDDTRFFVAAIVRSTSGTVEEVGAAHEVLPDVHGVRDLAWLDADTLVVLGSRADEPLEPLQTDSDGLNVDDGIDPLRGLATVAAAPPESKLALVAGTDSGQLQMWDPSLGWRPLGPGRDPAYPG